MPQRFFPAMLFLWMACLIARVSAAPLELLCEIGGRTYPVAKVERNRAFVLIDGKVTKVPRDVKWRIEGDLRANAQLVDWSPTYSLERRDTPDWEAAKFKEPYQVNISMWHRTEYKGKPAPSPFLANWPEGLPTAGLAVMAWEQEGQVIKAVAIPLPSTSQANSFNVGEPLNLALSEGAGQAVALFWRDGAFRPVAARFPDPAAQAAFMAVELGDTAALQAALEAGLKVDVLDREGVSLLHFAAEAGHLGVVNELLRAGVKPDFSGRRVSTPLSWAVKSHRPEVVERLLAAGADKDSGNKTSLLLSALKNRFNDIALMLIAAKADLSTEDSSGRSPWAIAMDNGMADVATAIATRHGGIDTDEDQAARVLVTQAGKGHTAVVKILLKDGVQPNVEARGYTALIAGAEPGDPELAKALITAGARPGDAGASGITPLMAAALHGRAAYAEVLLRAGADPNASFSDGSTALHIAGEARADAVTEVLLAHGANPLKPNKRGQTPLQIALTARARGPAEALVARGAAIYLPGADAPELLEIALTIDAVGVVKKALADGWSPNTVFRGAWPALLVATECRAQRCAEVLRAAGAKETTGPEIPTVVKAQELDARLAIAATVNARDPRDFADDFPSSTVDIDIVVDRNGEVRFARVAGTPDPLLAEPALTAVAQWKFTPPLRNKIPVATKVRIPFAFGSSRELVRELFEVDTWPVAVARVPPTYPMDLRRKNISGDVTVRFVVNAAGHTEHLRVVSSQHPDLDAAAVAALRQWVFKPGLLDGKPTATWVQQLMTFRLQ